MTDCLVSDNVTRPSLPALPVSSCLSPVPSPWDLMTNRVNFDVSVSHKAFYNICHTPSLSLFLAQLTIVDAEERHRQKQGTEALLQKKIRTFLPENGL